MKKHKYLIVSLLSITILAVILIGCNTEINYTLTFTVDGEVYYTLKTDGVSTISIPEDPEKEGYEFDGWFWDKDVWNQQLTVNSFLDAPISNNMTVYAKWKVTLYLRVNESNIADENGNYILFGEYPQTVKSDSVTVETVADGDGYYSGSDGERYAKVTASPYQSGYKFSTDASVTSGTVYYFKVEPLKWRILSESGVEALILCESIIANKRFDDSRNNYMNSEIRAWLNDEFYDTAFGTLQQSLILTTTVDNSVASTGYSSNPYACANTNDKIFLPSYAEMVNTSYGFIGTTGSTTTRERKTSDYSRATGAYMNKESSYYGNGYWWLRSPHFDYSYYARYVYIYGIIGSSSYVDHAGCGLVPALKISLS